MNRIVNTSCARCYTTAYCMRQVEVLLGLIRLQLEEAKLTDRDAMSSMLIHEGEEMVFEIEEFKIRLAEKEQTVVNQLHVSVCVLMLQTQQ
jgi:hypothetical protein